MFHLTTLIFILKLFNFLRCFVRKRYLLLLKQFSIILFIYICRNRRCPTYFGDFKECDLGCPVKSKRFFKVASETVCRYKAMIKYYQCKNRRQKKKINDLSSVLNDLMEKEKISSDQFLVLQVCCHVLKVLKHITLLL